MSASSFERASSTSWTPDLSAFPVRGHHARNLGALLTTGTLDIIEHVPLPFEEQNSGYGRDIFGTNEAEASAARAGIRKFFGEFRDLPDEAPVRLTAGQKDGACNSCIFGRHCNSAFTTADDIDVLDAVRRLACKRGVVDSIETGRTKVDGFRGAMPYVQLSAGLAKRLLGDEGFEAETYPWFARPLIKAARRLRSILD